MGSKRAGERCARSSSHSGEPSESPLLPLITPFVEGKSLTLLQRECPLIFSTDVDISLCKAFEETLLMRVEHSSRTL